MPIYIQFLQYTVYALFLFTLCFVSLFLTPLDFPSGRFHGFFRGSSPLGCGEREELRTFTMELSTFQQVPGTGSNWRCRRKTAEKMHH